MPDGLPGQSESRADYFVDIERRVRRWSDFTGYHWVLRRGVMGNAAVVSDYPEIRKGGGTVTLWGARRAARRAKRRVERMDRNRYLNREAVR